MKCQRGDVVLAWFPFASGAGGKRRPCVILHDSLVSCNNLATVEQSLINQVIGSLSATYLGQLNKCLKQSLETP
jgi:hypothetical protein